MCDGAGDIEGAISMLLGRASEVLDNWEAIAGIVVAPGTPFEPAALPALGEVRDMLERSAWLLSRIAAPLTPLQPPEP